jgi:Beta-xylosidase
MKKSLLTILTMLLSIVALGQNPYLPLWEYIPDGEPHIFEDPDKPGHQRVYVYGSHDMLEDKYCGLDQVVWSAPVDDLHQWRYDGVVFESRFTKDGYLLNRDGKGDVLYAPDIVEVMENGRKEYYFTPNNQSEGRKNMICKGYRPDGPFEVCNWNADGRTTYGLFGFDPAVFRDDDGKVYGYWGFKQSNGAELDPTTMCTVKPGTEVKKNMIPGKNDPDIFRFFEASSIRKIMGKYVFIYSRTTLPDEFGLYACNYNLAYAYSDNPLGPWTYGGTLIDGRARSKDEKGNVIPTAVPYGNTHGSLLEINGQWYVFYHRQTGDNEYQRQAMVAPVKVSLKDGKLLISEGEYTSEGFSLNGLNPFDLTPAGLACYLTEPIRIPHQFPNHAHSGSYVKATRIGDDGRDGAYSLHAHHSPVVFNTDSSVVGYKYFNMTELGKRDEATLRMHFKPEGVAGEIVFMLDSPWTSQGGKEIGRLTLNGNPADNKFLKMASQSGDFYEVDIPVKGLKKLKSKHSLYLLFRSDTKEKSLCELYDFRFIQ